METWDTIIKSKTSLFDIPAKEIWKYRGLAYILAKRNYCVQYKQTILGPFWMVFSIVISSGLFSFVFGYVANVSSGGIPYFLFYMSANVLWTFFSGCVTSNTGVFQGNAYLFGKVYFPRIIVPISNVLMEAFKFAIQFAVFIFVWIYYFMKGQVSFMGSYLLLAPLIILEMAVLGMSIGMLVSSMTTKYRDLNHFVGMGMQVLMYAAPVVYPLSQLSTTMQRIILLNPVASVIEAFRFVLTGSGEIHITAFVYSFVFTAVLFVVSVVSFNQTEKSFIDIV